jgi:uncharacterized membrane protein
MSSSALYAVIVCTAVGSGVVTGVFFAFSTFVMPALARLPAEQGIAAMQAINVAAINRWFMGAMFGAAATSLLLVITPFLGWSGPGSGLRLTGGVMYLLGIVVVTIAFNVPRNDALAVLSPNASEAAALWSRFLVEWTRWNHVRTVTGIAATVLLVTSLCSQSACRGHNAT